MCNVSLKIMPFSTVFTLSNNQQQLITVGYQSLIELHFKHSLPTGYEVEMAIITIEDAIESMQSSADIKGLASVSMAQQDVTDIKSLLSSSDADNFSAVQLEYGFNRIADHVMGRSIYDNTFVASAEFISKLLILRELMHHLQIEKIKIV